MTQRSQSSRESVVALEATVKKLARRNEEHKLSGALSVLQAAVAELQTQLMRRGGGVEG